MKSVTRKIKNFIADEDGATMIEYALMVALIAIVCIAAVTLLGGNANNKFNTAANNLQ